MCGCGDSTAPDAGDAPPATIHVGHVGHDHQIALGVAALHGERFRKDFGVYLKEVKPREVYDLIEGDKALARLHIRKVKGGSAMPAAMAAGAIDVGFGGVAAVAKFIDKGQPFAIVAPLHTDGDFLVVRPDSPATDWKSFIATVKAAEKPVKIGYKMPTAVAKLIFVRALAAEGVAWSEAVAKGGAKVVMVNCKGAKNIIPSMAAGGIDGFVMNQPVPSIAQVKKGIGRIIADLKDLPPAGQWTAHPCCCVAATAAVMKDHPEALKALLKVIHLATKLMCDDVDLAVAAAAKWTRTDPKVEAHSVRGIPYLSVPGEPYRAGMRTWAQIMIDEKQFTNKLKGLTPEEIAERICDMSLCKAAAEELKAKGLMK
jgi:NitT/TauT family transport system substrate-binding protein